MRDEQDDTPDAVCRVGDHKHRGDSRICDRHLEQMRAELADVARFTAQLTHHLVPGSTPAGDKVSTTRIGSPTSARLDALNAIGPGGREVRRDSRQLRVQVRQWSTRTPYRVENLVTDERGKTSTVVETRYVPTWHSQLVTDGVPQPSECACGRRHDADAIPTGTAIGRPLLALDDDQVGMLPPAEWADEWVRKLRILLGHTTSPIRGKVDLACDADQRKRLERARIGEALRAARRVPTMLPAMARLIAVQRAYEQHLQQTSRRVTHALLGVRDDGPQHQDRVTAAMAGGELGDTTRIRHDAVSAEWAVRYGHAQTAAAVELDTRRLADWLELAFDTDDPRDEIDFGAFAAELRSLRSQLAHIVGAITDEQWLGRCPALLRDADGEETTRVCGAGLWQDPYRSLIECGRCRSTWAPKDWLGLAALIRAKWPIDRRRRYTEADRRAAETQTDRLPKCTGCERTMTVEWRDCTGRRDRTRHFTPARLVCPAGCLASATVVAA